MTLNIDIINKFENEIFIDFLHKRQTNRKEILQTNINSMKLCLQLFIKLYTHLRERN